MITNVLPKCCKCDSEARRYFKNRYYCEKHYEMEKGIRDKKTGRKIIREEEIKE